MARTLARFATAGPALAVGTGPVAAPSASATTTAGGPVHDYRSGLRPGGRQGSSTPGPEVVQW
ncbi:hypothetical protein ACFV1L_18755 [Kitasatospora sp. NPDC059646]|uniref:hypothetical protein n=1 Tax=Kitasatospora sp. NPDC059646 TaxID=3346893 RepID=UPI0036AC01A7